MDISIIIPIIISVISFVFSIVTFFLTYFYNSKRDMSDNELRIYNEITNARNYRLDCYINKNFDKNKYGVAIDENYLNAFEYASHMYLSRKVNKKSFETMFKDLYSSLFSDFGFNEDFLNRFNETCIVYNKWKQEGIIK